MKTDSKILLFVVANWFLSIFMMFHTRDINNAWIFTGWSVPFIVFQLVWVNNRLTLRVN